MLRRDRRVMLPIRVCFSPLYLLCLVEMFRFNIHESVYVSLGDIGYYYFPVASVFRRRPLFSFCFYFVSFLIISFSFSRFFLLFIVFFSVLLCFVFVLELLCLFFALAVLTFCCYFLGWFVLLFCLFPSVY